MKDFIKWLGVNDKIAKLVIWIFIIMVMLIVTNAMLASVGFSHYRITYDNLKQIKLNGFLDALTNWIYIILNFYAMLLLIFRVKEAKSLFKYSILYLFLNIIVFSLSNYVILQVFIILFIVVFSYLYSRKNKKYILYGLLSIIVNVIVQAITYIFKAKFITYNIDDSALQLILFSDYFIIMGIIILVKEIFLKKRSEVE